MDGHFIIQHVHEIYNNLYGTGQFNTGTSSEKFSLIEFGNYCFIDSLQQLKGSLDELVKANRVFKWCDKLEVHKLLRQKGIYPYEWVDSPEKFNATSLPPKESFYNSITEI
jgi:hypothetical protein